MRKSQFKECLKFRHNTVFSIQPLLLYFFLMSTLNINYCYCQTYDSKSFKLSQSKQLIIVIANKIDSKHGKLYFYERDNAGNWKPRLQFIEVMLGAKGLGFCNDLSGIFDYKMPRKKEGDLKSPAGLFYIHEAFAYYPIKTGIDLKILNKGTVCVDDTASRSYGKISNDSLAKKDWNSGEKMRLIRQYEYGIVIDQNMLANRLEGGSCIFVHIWSGEQNSTAGCTAMSKQNLLRLLALLEINKMPVILQLPRESYQEAATILKLPIIN